MKTIKVVFNQHCEPQDKSGRVYEAGSIHELPSTSARHWIKRGAAGVYHEPIKEKSKGAVGKKTPEEKKEVQKTIKMDVKA